MAFWQGVRGLFQSREVYPRVGNLWCGILQETEHPCHKPAAWLMSFKNNYGFIENIFVCDGHHPDKNFWTRRHFDIRCYRIITVTPTP